MTFKSHAAALAAVIAFATPAGAADLYRPYQPEPVRDRYDPQHSWNGFYIGLHAGYGFGDDGWVEPEGAFGGGQAGFNVQLDRLVLGVEGDISGADINDTNRFTFAGIPARASTDVDWLATLRGRAGLAFDRTLIYATAGVAWADVDQRLDIPGASFRSSETETGYVVGGGVEHALTDRWSTKLEYQYVDLGDVGAGGASSELDFHTVRAGLNFKF